jgi:hypothetical protein
MSSRAKRQCDRNLEKAGRTLKRTNHFRRHGTEEPATAANRASRARSIAGR